MGGELRGMTAREERWWKELKAVLRRMPKNVELHARHGGDIGIAPVGSYCSSLNRDGHADNVGDTEWDRIYLPRLDGRDSHI